MKSGSFSGCMIRVTADSRQPIADSRQPIADSQQPIAGSGQKPPGGWPFSRNDKT